MERMVTRTSGTVHWTEDGERALCRPRIRAYWSPVNYRRVNCQECLAKRHDDGAGVEYMDEHYAAEGAEMDRKHAGRVASECLDGSEAA